MMLLHAVKMQQLCYDALVVMTMQQILTDNISHPHDEHAGFIKTYLPPHYSWARHNSIAHVTNRPRLTSPVCNIFLVIFPWFSCRICIWLWLTLFALHWLAPHLTKSGLCEFTPSQSILDIDYGTRVRCTYSGCTHYAVHSRLYILGVRIRLYCTALRRWDWPVRSQTVQDGGHHDHSYITVKMLLIWKLLV